MIEVTRLNGSRVWVNAHMIETMEANPDTVLTLNTERKLIVKETAEEIRDLVVGYNRKIFVEKTGT